MLMLSILLVVALFEATSAMRFSAAFAASVFGGVEELLTVPWYQGVEQIVSAFDSKWIVLEHGGIATVKYNNSFSYIWSLYKPFQSRHTKLDFLYIGFKNGAMVGYGTSSAGLNVPGEAWWQPDRNHSCDFTYNGVAYKIQPDEEIPWKRRTKAQSGCCMTYDGHTDTDSGDFRRPTYAFHYDPTVRPWYIQAIGSGAGWSSPYIFAGNGALGITAAAPLYNTDGSEILGAAAADYELITLDEYLASEVEGIEDTTAIFIVDNNGDMISSSLPGIVTDRANTIRLRATNCTSAIVKATAQKILESYDSFSAASTIKVAVDISEAGLFWAQSRELLDGYGLHWHIVVVEQVDCDRGYYQRDQLEMDGSLCSKCPQYKTCRGGAWLPMPKKGYFSPMKDSSDEATQCLAETNCLGGVNRKAQGCYKSGTRMKECLNNKTDEYGSSFICQKGSFGRLCSECDDDYYYSVGEGCLACEGSVGELIVFIVITSVTFVAAILVWSIYGDYISANFPLITSAVFDTGRSKVILTNIQIIGSVAWSTGVRWPEPFKTFSKALSIAELNAFEILPIACIGSLDLYSYALIQTTVPLIVVYVLYIRWKFANDVIYSPSLNDARYLSAAVNRARADKYRADFIGWSSLILYVLLPSANLTLVRVIKCMDFPDGTSWVAADLSLKCSHTDGTLVTGHAFMMVFSWLMMVFWGPIGVPLIFWHLLDRHREEIWKYDKEHDTMECPAVLKPLKFLFSHYTPEHYNAEWKECLRRLLMMGGVAVLSKAGKGGAQNALCGTILAVGFAIFQREHAPWDNPSTNALSSSFSWVVFFVFFGAFVITTSEEGNHGIFSPTLVSYWLIFLTIGAIVLAILQQSKDFKRNAELLLLKTHIADFREQVVGIAFAKRTIRPFERMRFLSGDWAMEPSEISAEQRKELFRAAGVGEGQFRNEQEETNYIEIEERFHSQGLRVGWYWQEEAARRDNWSTDEIYPDPELEEKKNRIWVKYSNVLSAQLESTFLQVQQDKSTDPTVIVDLDGLYTVNCARQVQISSRTGFERPCRRVESKVESCGRFGNMAAAGGADAKKTGENYDRFDISSFTSKDGPGTAITLNADKLDARPIAEDDIPPFPYDLIENDEQILLLQKGQLIQIQKKRDDGWCYGFVVYTPNNESENLLQAKGKKDDRTRPIFSEPSRAAKISPMSPPKLVTMQAPDQAGTGGEGPADFIIGEVPMSAQKSRKEARPSNDDDDGGLEGCSAGWFPMIFVRAPQMNELKDMQDAMGGSQAAQNALSVPDYWSQASKNGLTTDVQFILLTMREHSEELNRVQGNFMKRLGKPGLNPKIIKSISRVENLSLWQSYAAKKSSMVLRAKNEGAVSSQYEKEMMYHGTSPDVIPKIAQQGFNRGFAGKNAVRYGKGVYFALTSNYSNNYAFPDEHGIKHMFVCRVLAGETSQGHNEQLIPAVRVAATNQMYDSTTDQIDAPEPNDTGPSKMGTGVRQMYVTYHDAQAYPEYLIDYAI